MYKNHSHNANVQIQEVSKAKIPKQGCVNPRGYFAGSWGYFERFPFCFVKLRNARITVYSLVDDISYFSFCSLFKFHKSANDFPFVKRPIWISFKNKFALERVSARTVKTCDRQTSSGVSLKVKLLG